MTRWLRAGLGGGDLRRLLPFVPRGNGDRTRGECGLTPPQWAGLRKSVRRKRRALSGRVDVRWLDFSARPLHVVEADGSVVLEGATEALDRLLCTIPGDATVKRRIAVREISGPKVC